jgi:purine nucleosidase
MEKVIIDGDWGGDEMQLATVLLANPDKVDVLGVTCVFGNTHHDQVVENARNILKFIKAENIKVYPGAKGPSDSPPLEGDGAHGSDGIGNVNLEKSTVPYESKQAVDFILEQLRENEPGTVTITASAPLTNIAEAFRREPETMKRAKQIIIMGGCTHDIPAHDIPIRRGNITHYGEFNFQQAAADAQTVMQSGLPITLLPMNCTQQLTVTPQRQAAIAQTYLTNPTVKNALLGMMTAPAELDRAKFNISPVMHDINCALYLLHPEGYDTVRGDVNVLPKDGVEWPKTKMGHTEFSENPQSNVTVATGIKNPDKFFDVFMESITARIPPQRQAGRVAVGAG